MTGQTRPIGAKTLQTPNNVTFFYDETGKIVWVKVGAYGDYEIATPTNLKTINNISIVGQGNIQIGSGARRLLYLSDVAAGISDYEYLTSDYSDLPAPIAIKTVSVGPSETYIGGWSLFDFTVPERLIPSGNWKVEFRANVTILAGHKDAKIFAKIFKRNSGGTEIFIFETLQSSVLSETVTFYEIEAPYEDVSLNDGEVILVKIYGIASGLGVNPEVQFRYSDQTGARLEIPDAGTAFHDELNNVNLAGAGVQFGHVDAGNQDFYGVKAFRTGLAIPTGAANNSVLKSDAVGNASWITLKTFGGKFLTGTGELITTQGLNGLTPTWNALAALNAGITLSGNTTITLTNLTAGASGNLTVINPATAYTITFAGYTNKISPAIYTSANTVTASGGSKFDVFSWYYDGSAVFWNGTKDYK